MSQPELLFSPDYFIARDRFRESATTAGGRMHSIVLDARGPNDEDLSIDIAWFGAAQPRRVLLHSSGLHGVEGFAGSAIQLQLINDLPALPDDTALVVVHTLNPSGMAYLRRVNENNVDLNRNFLSKTYKTKTVSLLDNACASYRNVDSFLNPQTAPRRDFYMVRAGFLILKYGITVLKQAVVGGQYWFPRGLFYGGKFSVQAGRIQSELEQGPKDYQSFLIDRLSATEFVLAIDVHSGLGKYGRDMLLVEQNQKRLREMFGRSVAPMNPKKGPAYHAWGSIGSKIPCALPNTNVLFVTQEFGTYAPTRVLHALREENRWHHYGAGTLGHRTKRVLKETFCPEDVSWRRAVVNRGMSLVKQGLFHLGDLRTQAD